MKQYRALARTNYNIPIDDSGRYMIHDATKPSEVEWLLHCGADVNARTITGSTPLFTTRKLSVIFALIACGADVNAVNNWDRNALYARKNIVHIRALVRAGVNPRKRDIRGDTLLHNDRLSPRVVKFYVKHGVDVNAENIYGRTPIFDAMYNQKVFNALIKYGANPNAVDNCGKTVLDRCHGKSVLHLVLFGVDVHCRDTNILQVAVFLYFISLIQL